GIVRGPVEAVAGSQTRLSGDDFRQQAVAIPLELMEPVVSVRWGLAQRRQLWRRWLPVPFPGPGARQCRGARGPVRARRARAPGHRSAGALAGLGPGRPGSRESSIAALRAGSLGGAGTGVGYQV